MVSEKTILIYEGALTKFKVKKLPPRGLEAY